MDFRHLYLELEDSLKVQEKIFENQLILNPVENYPDSCILNVHSSFLHGLYNSDKTRSDSEQIKTKIQFSGREQITQDINKIYRAWCDLLGAEKISMRFFSGLHAHTVVFMAITNINDKVMLLPEKAGGHMATKAILQRLGLNVSELIIDYVNMRINVPESKLLIDEIKPNIIFVDRSEGLVYEDFSWLSAYSNIYKIFDASQFLTNIVAGDYKNPFDMGFDAILSTTHKNLPGPQRALFAAKKADLYWKQIEENIGTYVSNMHSYSIYSLGFILDSYEQLCVLSRQMLCNTEKLKTALLSRNIDIVMQVPLSDEKNTHHIWIKCNNQMEAFKLYSSLERANIIVNYRLLPYDIGYGIRIGLSAATKAGLKELHISELSDIISEVHETYDCTNILKQKAESFVKRIKGNNNGNEKSGKLFSGKRKN